MWASWFDPLERVLIVVLSAFPILPFGVSSTSLIALVAIRLLRAGFTSIPTGPDWLVLTPALLLLLAWALHGFAPDGLRELRLWPILLAAMVYFKTSPYRSLFNQAFVLSAATGALIVLGALLMGEPLPDEYLSQFIRDAITERFAWHPTYLSTVWAWASLLLWGERFFQQWQRMALTALLVFMATVAGGKMPVLALALVGTFGVLRFASWSGRMKVLAVTLLIASLVAASFSPTLRDRVRELNHLRTDYSEDAWLSSTELRLGVWKCAWKCSMENAWLGVGLGNTRAALEVCFEGYGQSEFFDTEFNTHNQYLHFWLSGGIVTFMLFLAYCLGLLCQRRAYRTALLFLLFFLLISLTENYFSRQTGMMLFALFLQIPDARPLEKSRISH